MRARPVLIAGSGFPEGRNSQMKKFPQPTKNEKKNRKAFLMAEIFEARPVLISGTTSSSLEVLYFLYNLGKLAKRGGGDFPQALPKVFNL